MTVQGAKFNSIGCRDKREYNGVGLVEISRIFAAKEFFIGQLHLIRYMVENP